MITCPRCGKTSSNREDEANRYCGACNRYHDAVITFLLAPVEINALLPLLQRELVSLPMSDPNWAILNSLRTAFTENLRN